MLLAPEAQSPGALHLLSKGSEHYTPLRHPPAVQTHPATAAGSSARDRSGCAAPGFPSAASTMPIHTPPATPDRHPPSAYLSAHRRSHATTSPPPQGHPSSAVVSSDGVMYISCNCVPVPKYDRISLRKSFPGSLFRSLWSCAINHAMQHQRVQRIQRPHLHHALVGVGVAIGDPSFAICSHARRRIILAAAPDRVRMHHPERRRPRARREIDKQVRLRCAQFADQMDHRGKIAVEPAARKHRVHISRSIKLELVHAILSASFPEPHRETPRNTWAPTARIRRRQSRIPPHVPNAIRSCFGLE